ncbi:hypothetical protein AK812_SmicGene41594 [Symbiodinium microadriaticum]|uniref:Uncharacterized protein n=1 Tax=Symbiodinium microadriaticum TaxID=2951 RepID=A0A1Q9C5R9_SYMMI|nr:hypothetical protein AK812_SmicGene41594 [Symbiodinium microadriaticum]
MLRTHPRSTYAHDAKWGMFAFWLAAAAQQVAGICFDVEAIHYSFSLFQFGWGVQCVALGWTLHLLQMRMTAIRSSPDGGTCGSTFGSNLWIVVMCCSWHIRHTCDLDLEKTWPVILVSLIVLCTVWVAYTTLTCKRLVVNLRLLLQEAKRVRGPPRKQAIWAAQVVGMEMLICAMLGLTMCCYAVMSAMSLRAEFGPETEEKYLLVQHRTFVVLLIIHIDWVVNSLGLGLLSGILWQGRPPDGELELEHTLTRGLISMSNLLAPTEKEVYDQVVKQLANRSFRLSALLHFWERLLDGQVMPGFDPRRSLTNDVVRRAIIPESRDGQDGSALAAVWSSTETTAQIMVTHNWSNGFGSLVAAILADALGLAAYEKVADKIAAKAGIEKVRAKLVCKLETTYWVCAFSVNQHASICDSFGTEPPQGTSEWSAWDRRRYDSVTGHAFQLCSCQVEKVFSHTDARCELNKFDDMMTHLALEVAGFAHLIVVDDAFDVLFRAWCVAEIFEASVLGMEPRIQVPSQSAVDQNYDRLRLLDVRQCTSTSQADKEMIISKISDVDVFNEKIQNIVFSEELGLFAQWVDGNERSRQVGRIVRRCKVHAANAVEKPVYRSRSCCASLRLLTIPDGDCASSEDDCEESVEAETSDSSSRS